MECWTDFNWKTRKNCQENKSNGSGKQTDDFLETFPNFMTLTKEERHEFFQTLHAAKIKLEKCGVTVRPHFGTVHDHSWNSPDAFGIKKERSTGSDVSTSKGVEILTTQSNIPTNLKSNISVGRSNSIELRNAIVSETLEKNSKEDKTCTGLSQENLEPDLGNNESLENFNSEDEIGVEMLSETHKRDSLKIVENHHITPSLSYEVLNLNDKLGEKDEMLRITGTKLKVQVTLTSADNERLRKTLSQGKVRQSDDHAHDDADKSSGKKPKGFSSKKDKNLEFKCTKSSKEKIDDPEMKDFLNVEEEQEEVELPGKNEKSSRRRSFEKGKSKGNRQELRNQKNVSRKVEGRKKKVSRDLPQDQLLLEKECQLKNTTSEIDKDRLFQESDSKVSAEEEKTGTNIKEQKDNEIQTLKRNLTIRKKGSPQLKKDTKETQQSILAVATVKEGMELNASLEQQETEAAGKKQNKKKSERQQRIERLQKYLQKREGFYQQKLKKKDDLNEEAKKKTLNAEEAINEGNSEKVSASPCNKENEEASDSEKKTIAAHCGVKETEEVQKDSADADLNSTKVPDSGTNEAAVEEKEKVAEISEATNDTLEECDPPFRPGKVVFVDDNVIDKIRNVILDLDRKARAYNCDTENEYLILIVEYVEYLSTVMATLFEDQVLNSTIVNPNVKFDDKYLTEIEQRFRISTPTTDSEFQSDEESEAEKKLKRKKHRKGSFLRCLRTFFNCGKKKKRRKGASVQSPALKLKS